MANEGLSWNNPDNSWMGRIQSRFPIGGIRDVGGAVEGQNSNAGQPGSAGEGWGKTISDAAMGLAGGALAPGFGTLAALSRMATSDFSPFSISDMFSPAPTTHPTDDMIANMKTDPSAYGLANAGVSVTGQMTQDMSPQQQAAQQNALDASSAISGAGVGGDTGIGLGGSGDVGSTGGGTGNSGIGTGAYASGGVIRGPTPRDPRRDNVRISAQSGEEVEPRAAVRMFGPELEVMRKISLETPNRARLLRQLINTGAPNVR